jgi:putative metallohydrolase (TIGR04338 family)
VSRTRDSQRQRVYESEYALRGKLKLRNFKDIKDAQRYVERILGSSWYAKMFPVGRKHVTVQYKRGSAFATGGFGGIRLPKQGWHWAGKDLIVLHELAHVLTPLCGEGLCKGDCGWHNEPWPHTKVPAAHGPEFTRIFLDLVRRWMGKAAYEAMKAEYRTRRVKVAIRSKVYYKPEDWPFAACPVGCRQMTCTHQKGA